MTEHDRLTQPNAVIRYQVPFMRRMYGLASNIMGKLQWLPPLLLRLSVGAMFFLAGRGKLMHLDRTTEFFAGLGIPFPHLNAIMAASTECFGGLLIVMGLLTRLASIPLAFVMVVAIATAKMGEVHNLGDFVGLSELAYLLIFVWLAISGPGVVSLDFLLCKILGKSDRPSPQ